MSCEGRPSPTAGIRSRVGLPNVTSTASPLVALRVLGAAPRSVMLTDCRTVWPAFNVYGQGSAKGRT